MATHHRKSGFLLNRKQHKTLVKYFPAWLLLGIIGIIVVPRLLGFLLEGTVYVVTKTPGAIVAIAGDIIEAGDQVIVRIGDEIDRAAPQRAPAAAGGTIAPLFTDQVDYWADDIHRWGTEYDLDPNLLATVMQIESCGHPTVSSVAGAQGLFQVMPFHFASTESQLDPDTNAMRGASVLNECLRMSDGDVGLAMACYNGGPSVLSTPYDAWLSEPQRYYRWGTGIYADAQTDQPTSNTLNQWLDAGGSALCDLASNELGLN